MKIFGLPTLIGLLVLISLIYDIKRKVFMNFQQQNSLQFFAI